MKRIFRPFFDALAFFLWIAVMTWLAIEVSTERPPDGASRLSVHIAGCDTCSSLGKLNRDECPWVDEYLRTLACNQGGRRSR